MSKIGFVALMFSCFVCTAPAVAATAVNCTSGETLTQAINALKPAAGYQNVTVSGACEESVSIPQGIAVSIVGASGASLTPPSGNPGFYVLGKLSLSKLSIVANNGSGVVVDQGGYATLTALNITGSGDGVDFLHGASGQVVNSSITVTGEAAIGAFGAGTVEIDATAPVDGMKGTTLSGSNYAFNCSQGTAILNAFGGNLTFKNGSVAGIQAGPCTVTTGVGTKSQILFENNFIGVFAKWGGSITLAGGVTIANNSNNALNAQQNGVISIFNYSGGVNTISRPSTNTTPLFGCYQGGQIYAPAITGYITPAPTSADIGCLHVGSP